MTKTILTKAFALVAAGMLMFSCAKPVEPTLSVTTEVLNFASDAGLEKVINVTSNQAWTVTCDADWLVIAPKTGENDGQFKITTTANETFSERSADVKISAATLTAIIKVVQVAATPNLGVVPTEIAFESEGGSQTFTISSNAGWSVAVPENDWVSATPTSGEGAGTVTVTAVPNTSLEARNVEITVTAEGLTQKVAVAQAGATPSISVDHESVVFTREGGEFIVEVTSNTTWRLAWPTKSSGTDINGWLGASQISGEAGTTRVVFYASGNNYLSSRNETVDFVATAGGVDTEVKAPVAISQDPGLPSRASDSLALVAIYNAADGANWKADRVWDLNKPMNEWYGITLNADGRVSGIKILAKTIEKEWTMPAEIGDLTELTDLRFNSACVSGNFVESLYKLTKLVSLYFQTNNISGSFSEKVAVWKDLKDLYINDNADFSGTLPKEFGQLKKLANINIAKTSIGGDVPAEFSNCDALVNFMVYSTKLTSLPDNFDQWPALKLLQVYDIPTLTGPLPASVGNCKKVTSVWLHTCNFEGNIPESYGNLPATCTQLRLMNNKLSGQVPAAVKANANWSKWKAEQYIFPQQDGYGLTE